MPQRHVRPCSIARASVLAAGLPYKLGLLAAVVVVLAALVAACRQEEAV